MDYRNFELKVKSAGGRDYEIEVRSPGGEKTTTVRFPFDELALENRLKALEIALLKSSGTRRDIRVAEQDTVEDFGKALFETLISGDVRDLYRVSRAKANEEGRGLRLRLRVEAPDLASLPWEYLYDASEGDFVCLSMETPIVRYLQLDRPPEPIAIEPPLRILGMVASPKDRTALDVENEKARLERATARLRDAGLLTLDWLPGESWRDLQKAMRRGPWHVFHFVGHGGFDPVNGEGLIALTNDDGSTFKLSATQLGRLLADHNSLRLCVLNSCEGAKGSGSDVFSSTASILMRRGLPAVVAMQYEITDKAAIEFAQTFYEDLAEGVSVDAAVAEARKAISMSLGNSLEWGTPVLFMRAPDGVLFNIEKGSITQILKAQKRPDVEAGPLEEPDTTEVGLTAREAVEAEVTPPAAERPAAPPPRTSSPAAATPVTPVPAAPTSPEPSPGAPTTSTPPEPTAQAPAAPQPSLDTSGQKQPAAVGPSQAPAKGWASKKWWLLAAIPIAALLAWVLFPSGPVEVAEVALTPSAAQVDVGEQLSLDVRLIDSGGADMLEDYLDDPGAYTLVPSTSDPSVASVATDGLTVLVAGVSKGSVTIQVAADPPYYEDGAIGTATIEVLVSGEAIAEAQAAEADILDMWDDAAVGDVEILEAAQALESSFGGIFEDAGIDGGANQERVALLTPVVSILRELDDLLSTAIATVTEEEALLLDLVEGAPRASPAVAAAEQRLADIEAAVANFATVIEPPEENFVTCATFIEGERTCPPGAVSSELSPGLIYLSMRLNSPGNERLTVQVFDADGQFVLEKDWSVGRNTSAAGYRVYDRLGDIQQPGEYTLVLSNGNEDVIGRARFSVID